MISNEKRLVDRVESLKMLKPQNETLMQQLANAQKKCQGLEVDVFPYFLIRAPSIFHQLIISTICKIS